MKITSVGILGLSTEQLKRLHQQLSYKPTNVDEFKSALQKVTNDEIELSLQKADEDFERSFRKEFQGKRKQSEQLKRDRKALHMRGIRK